MCASSTEIGSGLAGLLIERFLVGEKLLRGVEIDPVILWIGNFHFKYSD